MDSRCLDRIALRCGVKALSPAVRAYIFTCISELEERRQRVLELHYQENKKLWEIGNELGISAARARQIEMNSIHVLRRRLRNRQYELVAIRHAYTRSVREA